MKDEKYIQNLGRKPEGTRPVDLGTDGKIRQNKLNWLVVGFCKHSNEPLGSRKDGEFPD
jgi:hypothetical protein